MKTVIGNFKELVRWHVDDPEVDAGVAQEPIEGACIELRLSHPATASDGTEADELVQIPLDQTGAISSDTRIWPNDELKPRGTHYKVTVYSETNGQCYNENLSIVGGEPINLNALVPLEKYPPDYEPELKPVRPQLVRKPGVNYHGFFGGVIHCPTGDGGSVGVSNSLSGRLAGDLLSSSFAEFAFTLPFKAHISCVSIFVEKPHLGNSLHVGLRDVSGKIVCDGEINVSNDGVARGKFNPVTLNAGDYTLVWATNFPSDLLKVRSAVATHATPLSLAGAQVPIMAFFKSE